MRKVAIYITLALTALSSFAASAQTQPSKAETKLYKKVMKKPSIAAYDNFIAKFPESSLAREFYELRDSTKLTKEIATETAHYVVPAGSEIADVIFYREHYRDYILCLTMSEPDMPFNLMRYYRIGLDEESQSWEVLDMVPVEKYTQTDGMVSTDLLEGLTKVNTGTTERLFFSYLNYNESGKELEYVVSLIDPANGNTTNAMFYGKGSKNGASYKIEGLSPETVGGGIKLQEDLYLLNKLNENANLKTIPEADRLADDAIAWWQSKNPKALTNAKTLTFGILDAENGIVTAFKKASKEKSSKYTIAKFDLRGYTIICAQSRSTQEYFLVWCEPVCKNKKTDRYLNTIYFDNDTNFSMFYYKGNTTFKYHVGLATKSISRQ